MLRPHHPSTPALACAPARSWRVPAPCARPTNPVPASQTPYPPSSRGGGVVEQGASPPAFFTLKNRVEN